MKKITNISFVFIIGLYVFMSVSFCKIYDVKALTSNNNLILSEAKEISEENSEENMIEESIDEDEIFSYRLKCIVLILITSLLLTHIQRYKKYKVVKKYKEVENTNENIIASVDNQYDIMDVNNSFDEDIISVDSVDVDNKANDEIIINTEKYNKTSNLNKTKSNTNRNNSKPKSSNTNKRKGNSNTNRTNKTSSTSNKNSKNSNKTNYNANRNNSRKSK